MMGFESRSLPARQHAAQCSLVQPLQRPALSARDGHPQRQSCISNSGIFRYRVRYKVSQIWPQPAAHSVICITLACNRLCRAGLVTLDPQCQASSIGHTSSAEQSSRLHNRLLRRMHEGDPADCLYVATSGRVCADAGKSNTDATWRRSVGPLAVLYPATASCDLDGHALLASKARLQRLTQLCLLRKLYRNMLRAENLLQQPAPLHPATQTPSSSKFWQRKSAPRMQSIDEDDEEAVEQRDAAVQLVAEMQLTAEQLRVRTP